ncbi:hypothetical protein ACIQU1_14835 [Streptomyces angustmyceticus]|uniref:hypothetical protein n=1 Tax=Streptomyces angustmyceticus TaxID=285578 RepID=UPI0037F1566E
MTDARLLDFPGSSIRLVKDVEDLPLEHPRLAREALAAAFDMSNELCIPLSMEISTAYWEDEFDLPVDSPAPSREFGMLRRFPLPDRVSAEPRLQNEQVVTTDEVSMNAAVDFLDDYLTPSPSDTSGRSIGWQELQFNATMARLPDDYPTKDPQAIQLEVAKGIVVYPVERHGDANWVSGPIGASVVHAPFEYRLHRNPGEIVFDFSTYWSIWAPGGPGRPAVEKGVEFLLGNGWEME